MLQYTHLYMISPKPQVVSINTAALKLMAASTMEETYAAIVTQAQELANALYGSIFVYQDKKLKRVFSTVPQKYQVEPRKNGYSYQAFTQKKAIILDIQDFKKVHPEYENKVIKKNILIPLSFEKVSLGVIGLDSTQKTPFTEDQLTMLQVFGSLASLKLRNMMLIDELNKAIETRDLFISMASHELKTPLTTMSAYAQLIERNVQNQKAIKIEWLQTLKLSSTRMTRLINELLHVNQIRTGKMIYKYELLEPEVIVNQALTDFKLSYPEQLIKSSNKISDSEIQILVDRDKMVQVVINLLNNAAKFTDDDKKVEVILELKNHKVVISVKDQGSGIEKEDLDNLFQEFYKAKSTKEGLGLGLYISKQIVKAHRGTIQVRSVVGKGTIVQVSLPSIEYD